MAKNNPLRFAHPFFTDTPIAARKPVPGVGRRMTDFVQTTLEKIPAPKRNPPRMTLQEIVGGAPYGATTVAGGDGSRQPSAIELDGARHQGGLVAKTAAKLFG